MNFWCATGAKIVRQISATWARILPATDWNTNQMHLLWYSSSRRSNPLFGFFLFHRLGGHICLNFEDFQKTKVDLCQWKQSFVVTSTDDTRPSTPRPGVLDCLLHQDLIELKNFYLLTAYFKRTVNFEIKKGMPVFVQEQKDLLTLCESRKIGKKLIEKDFSGCTAYWINLMMCVSWSRHPYLVDRDSRW